MNTCVDDYALLLVRRNHVRVFISDQFSDTKSMSFGPDPFQWSRILRWQQRRQIQIQQQTCVRPFFSAIFPSCVYPASSSTSASTSSCQFYRGTHFSGPENAVRGREHAVFFREHASSLVKLRILVVKHARFGREIAYDWI